MWPRATPYRTLDGLAAEHDAVPWYWRAVASGAAMMLLGGFLILPVTFETTSDLRVSATGLGVFGIALLTAGFALSGLLCFAVRNPLFLADAILLPALGVCAIGLLTILYDFLVFTRYTWKLPATLLTIAAAMGTVVFGLFLLNARWQLRGLKKSPADVLAAMPLAAVSSPGLNQPPTPQTPSYPFPGAELPPPPEEESDARRWQDTSYYDNYVRNMFPSAVRAAGDQNGSYTSTASTITEEEMQRQQLLMLLLRQEDPSATMASTGSSTTANATFRIDWQEGRDDENTPAPTPQQTVMRRLTQHLRPWDGVWRTAAQVAPQQARHADSREEREARRREIERGR